MVWDSYPALNLKLPHSSVWFPLLPVQEGWGWSIGPKSI